MSDARDELIEAMARAIYQSRNGHGCVSWSFIDRNHKRPYIGDAEAAAAAIPGLVDVIEGRAVIVPRECTEAMRAAAEDALSGVACGDLALDIAGDVYAAMIEARME